MNILGLDFTSAPSRSKPITLASCFLKSGVLTVREVQVIPDYAGFGMSGGSPGERECAATADAALDHLLSREDVDPARVVAAGWSLGSGVAVDLASRRPVAGLAIFCSFTSMADMGRLAYPFIPVSWLLSHRFDNEAKVARISCPVLIGHGRVDTVIPFSMSERLAAAGALDRLREALGPRRLGHARVHVGVLVGLSGDGRSEIGVRRADRQIGRRVSDRLQVVEMAVGVAGLTFGRLAEVARDLRVAFHVGHLGEVEVPPVGLRLPGERVFEVLVGLRSFQLRHESSDRVIGCRPAPKLR